MPISQNVPDATFVSEIAGLVHPEPKLQSVPRGQSVIMAGGKHTLIGAPLLAEPKTLKVSTLSAVVDAYNNLSALNTKTDAPLIQVVNPTCVLLLDPSVGDERQQFVYLQADADAPRHSWGQYQSLDQFIIFALSSILPGEGRNRILDYVGSLTAGLATEVEDDGATQSVVAKRGITRAGQPAKFENPVPLAPYRTFAEVTQPASPFVLRLRTDKQGEAIVAHAALFEADGGQWRTAAISTIGEYLREKLPNAVVLA